MLLALIVSLIYGESDWWGFVLSSGINILGGSFIIWLTRKASRDIGKREGFIIVSLVWIIFSLLGSLPYLFTGAIPNFTDAFFETRIAKGGPNFSHRVLTNVSKEFGGVLAGCILGKRLGDVPPEEQLRHIDDPRGIRGGHQQPAAGGKNAVELVKHNPRRKSEMLENLGKNDRLIAGVGEMELLHAELPRVDGNPMVAGKGAINRDVLGHLDPLGRPPVGLRECGDKSISDPDLEESRSLMRDFWEQGDHLREASLLRLEVVSHRVRRHRAPAIVRARLRVERRNLRGFDTEPTQGLFVSHQGGQRFGDKSEDPAGWIEP